MYPWVVLLFLDCSWVQWNSRVYQTHPQICRWCFDINYQWDQNKLCLSWKCFWTAIVYTFHFITYRQMLSNPGQFFSMLMNRAVSSLISKADEQGCVESALDTVYVWNMDRDRKSGVWSSMGTTDTVPAVTLTWRCQSSRQVLSILKIIFIKDD